MDYKALFLEDSQLELDVGIIVPLNKVNKLLFGTSDIFPIIGKIPLMNAHIIIEKDKNYYLKLNKLEDYIKLVRNQNERIPFFPYNYYNLFEPNNVDYKAIFEPIKEYLNYLDNDNSQLSETIKYIINPKNILNCELISSFDTTYCLRFNKKGKPLFITLNMENLDSPLGAVYGLSYDPNRDNNQYQKLFEEHKKVLLMESPERFLITNLERVTGDETFATNIVKSYLSKNEFNTPIIGICTLVLWKNKESMFHSIHQFFKNYPHLINRKIEDIIDNFDSGEVNTNFEGFNKFLLSIEVNDLQQWEVKEQINELYYKITHELIRSFEILYLNK
jgi:hypothetical protein